MASASADIDQLLECLVCFEIMKEPKKPKVLYCGHSVCSSCMDNLTVGGEGRTQTCVAHAHFTVSCVGSDVECPKCRNRSHVPQDGFPTNFQLADLIHHQTTHKCMMCDKPKALDDMIMCHSCGDLSMCLHCAFRSHEGHENEELHNHVKNQVKQLQQWKDEKLPILESLRLFPPSTVTNKCKALLDQYQTQQLTKRIDFETKLRHLIDSSGSELNAGNGYKFDFASLESQFQTIQDEHNQAMTKCQEMVSKMLLSGDDGLPEDDQICTAETGILLTDGGFFEFYSPSINTAQLIDIEMQKRYGYTIGVLSDGTVMVTGGRKFDASSQTAPTQIIDLVSKQVTLGPQMTTGRHYAASAMMGAEMYVCGGYDEKENTLSSCEVFRNGQLVAIASMNLPRYGHAVVALGGMLYAIGGRYNSRGMVNSVERYSPDTNSWELIAPLNEARMDFSAAVSNGYIYVAGGCVQSCERYCSNANKWEIVAPMNKGRRSFSLVPFGNKLYALGGHREMTVESYDAEKNQWKMEGIALRHIARTQWFSTITSPIRLDMK